MPNYITLFKLTQQGAQTVKDLPNRVEQNKARMQKLGIELKSWHVTMGQYDVVAIYDAPNEEAVAKVALALCKQGDAHSQTMRAFTLDEFKKIASALP